MERRRFDHLYEELSVALGRLAPRYALWLHMGEVGCDPERLSRDAALAYCRTNLRGFLRRHRLFLPERRHRSLERSLSRFDPRHPTPYEHMARLGGPIDRHPA
jgi:hypothetical protein